MHEHANKAKLDTYDKTQTELLTAASTDAQSKVDALKVTVVKKPIKLLLLQDMVLLMLITKQRLTVS